MTIARRDKLALAICTTSVFVTAFSVHADTNQHSATSVKDSEHPATPVDTREHAAQSVPSEGEPVPVDAEAYSSAWAHAFDGSTVTFGLQGQAHDAGGLFLMDTRLEWERWGMRAKLGGLAFKRAQGGLRDDGVGVFDPYVTYALISHPRWHLRAEAGLSIAGGNGVSIVAPAVGLSGEMKIVGPLRLEGDLHVAPFPAGQSDWTLGLGARFGWFAVSAGWEQRVIRNDAMLAEFTDRRVFSGPYVGLAVVF